MTSLRKARIKTVMKYTWPLYIISAIIVGLLLNFIFGIVHKLPAYKQLTLFISGEVTDSKKLESDLMNKFQDKELKSVTTISANISDGNYDTKLTVAGYSSADILIIPISRLEELDIKRVGLDLTNEVITSYYSSNEIYKQDEMGYGIKLNKEMVKEYMTLPNEDCYMILNGASENIGQYSKTQIKEHDMALLLAQDWGM